jgi:hypothetical protein
MGSSIFFLRSISGLARVNNGLMMFSANLLTYKITKKTRTMKMLDTLSPHYRQNANNQTQKAEAYDLQVYKACCISDRFCVLN